MPIKIYHAQVPNPGDAARSFSERVEALDEHALRLIAHMNTENLDEAFAWSQHLDHPWHEEVDRVLYFHPDPYPGDAPRSTSVGDVLERTSTYERYLVASAGLTPLPPRPAPELRFPLHAHEWRHLLVLAWDVALAWRLIAWRLIALRPARDPDGFANLAHYRTGDLAGWLGVDPARAMSDATDLRIPLLIVPVGDEFTPIDGHHRLYKALREGQNALPAFRLTQVEAAVIDLTAARLGARTSSAHYHTCGQRLTRYTVRRRDRPPISRYADAATPLLTHCPQCGRPLTPRDACPPTTARDARRDEPVMVFVPSPSKQRKETNEETPDPIPSSAPSASHASGDAAQPHARPATFTPAHSCIHREGTPWRRLA